MNGLMQSAGWPMLGLLWAWVKDFMLSIGIPGLIVLVCGAILLITASLKSLKFVQTGKGMSLTAAVMFAALGWMWLMNQPAGATARPIAPASLMAKEEVPSPIMASKAAPVATVEEPPAEMEGLRSAPIAAQSSPSWWLNNPLVNGVSTGIDFVSNLPPVHVPPIHPAVPAHAPAHHASAPAVSHTARIERPTAVATPSHTPVAGHSLGRAFGGSFAANNHLGGGLHMPATGREAARQRNMEALGQMGTMMQHNMNMFMGGGSHHPMMQHGGGHMGGMSHHGGHH